MSQNTSLFRQMCDDLRGTPSNHHSSTHKMTHPGILPQSTFRLGYEYSICNQNWSKIFHFSKTEPGFEIIPRNPVTKSPMHFENFENVCKKSIHTSSKYPKHKLKHIRLRSAPRPDEIRICVATFNSLSQDGGTLSIWGLEKGGKWVPISEWIFCSVWVQTIWQCESDWIAQKLSKRLVLICEETHKRFCDFAGALSHEPKRMKYPESKSLWNATKTECFIYACSDILFQMFCHL